MNYFNPLLFTCLLLQSQAIIFDCHCRHRDWIYTFHEKVEVARSVYTCTAKILKHGLNNDHLTEVSQDHKKSFRNKNVQLLNIENQPYDKIPLDIIKFFPNLLGLFVKDCKMRNVTKMDLKPFSKLKYLSLYGNFLEVIENDLFDYTPDLVFINFTWNRLKHIGSNILDTLNHLQMALFNGNICISQDVVHGSKEELKKLKQNLAFHCKPTDWMIEREQEKIAPKRKSSFEFLKNER